MELNFADSAAIALEEYEIIFSHIRLGEEDRPQVVELDTREAYSMDEASSFAYTVAATSHSS